MDLYYNLTIEDIKGQISSISDYFQNFKDYFRTKTRDVSYQGLEYIKSLFLCEGKRNMSKMSEQVTDLNEQALSHFISNSPWQEDKIIKNIGYEAAELFSKSHREKSFTMDESGFPKQGNASVGVGRQYCGNLGKVDNCQVGVYLGYTDGVDRLLLDKRLYLPKYWIEDPNRCEEAGIPKEERVFKTKGEFALEMIFEARKNGIPGEYISMDCFYGQQPEILNKLDAKDEVYYADIPSDTRVYLEYPKIGIPKKNGTKGREPSKERVLDDTAIEVKTLVNTDQLDWKIFKLRDTQRGELKVNFSALRVHRISNELPVEKAEWLLIREEIDGSNLKFTFSNDKEETPLGVLAKRQNTRYFVERAIQDAKGLVGMGDYQVIGWRGWHHHMTMALLAILFLSKLRQKLIHKAPMLTLYDVKEILKQIFPRKIITLKDRLKIIHKKHLNRYCSRISRLKRQAKVNLCLSS